jgi:hypothetical protein
MFEPQVTVHIHMLTRPRSKFNIGSPIVIRFE